MWSIARKHMLGEVYEPLVNDQWPHNPIFVENSHERQFSIIPKANIYGFLTKKSSPPEIQECDLWQGNICGVRCGKETYVGWGVRASGRWLMATQSPFLSKIAMNDYFQWHWRLTPRIFDQEMVSTINPRMWSMGRKHMCSGVYDPLVEDQWPHNPHFCRK